MRHRTRLTCSGRFFLLGVSGWGEAEGRDFFSLLAFFNHYSRNEPGETFFSNLALLSLANQSGATYEVVTPVHLTRLKGLVRARVTTLAGIVPHRITRVRSVRLVLRSRQFIRRDSILTPSLSLSSSSLSFFLCSLSTSRWLHLIGLIWLSNNLQIFNIC
jgi:hypothetical protein